jgi:hypothetical protein
MIEALALVGVLTRLWPFGDEITEKRYRPVRGWTLVVEKDRFSGEVQCRGLGRGMSYKNGVLTFHMGINVNTALAEVRLDQGPAKAAGEFAIAAAGRGAAFRTDNMLNPSGGLVHLPVEVVRPAATVSIRADRDRRAKTYRLRGLEQTLEAAKTQGCAVP